MLVDELAVPGGRLRQWRVTDAATLVHAWADPLVAQWNAVPDAPTLATATRWIGGVEKRYNDRLAIDFVIEIAEMGVIGEVGLSGFSQAHDGALIGYWLLPAARGHGHATRGVQAVTAWAHRVLELEVIVARCHESNLTSQAVAASAGYSHEATDGAHHELWRSRRPPTP